MVRAEMMGETCFYFVETGDETFRLSKDKDSIYWCEGCQAVYKALHDAPLWTITITEVRLLHPCTGRRR